MKAVVFVLLCLAFGVSVAAIVLIAEAYVHREYEDPDDWPDEDWVIGRGEDED